MRPVFKREKGNKREKTPRQKADQNILRLAYLIVALFLWLMGHVGHFLAVSREEVINNPYNPRLDNFARTVKRGKILSSDGTILAMTESGEDQGEVRVYPMGSLFSHVVGYSAKGKAGLEALGNFYLLTSHTNPASQIGAALAGQKNPGDQIVTTLDVELQKAAGEALGDRKGAVVAMEPGTGRILAMVSKPDFDPNTISDAWESILSEGEGQARLVNRACQGLYPPGSTFKIITLLEYMREHPEDYDQFRYDCDGRFEHGDYVLQCYHGQAHGSQTLAEAFANSCNGAFASLGLALDKKGMADTARELLFNGEQPVALSYSRSRFVMDEGSSDWETLQTAIGQGMTQMTPMHSLMVTAAIANGGTLMNPCLIDRVENELGEPVKRFAPSAYGRLMEEGEAEALKDMMVRVVTEGTGSALRTESYGAAGKTGSAEFETGRETHAWFAGFAPAEDPKIAVAVIVEEGGSGGQTAAPVARKLFDSYLGRANAFAAEP